MDDRELMQQALDALETVNNISVSAIWHRHFDDQIQALRERLSQPKPKPYDPMENNADYERGFIDGRSDQMKSSVDRAVNRMAKREWVGLTDEELEQVRSSCGYNQFMTDGEYADALRKAIEAKLREKNT